MTGYGLFGRLLWRLLTPAWLGAWTLDTAWREQEGVNPELLPPGLLRAIAVAAAHIAATPDQWPTRDAATRFKALLIREQLLLGAMLRADKPYLYAGAPTLSAELRPYGIGSTDEDRMDMATTVYFADLQNRL